MVEITQVTTAQHITTPLTVQTMQTSSIQQQTQTQQQVSDTTRFILYILSIQIY